MEVGATGSSLSQNIHWLAASCLKITLKKIKIGKIMFTPIGEMNFSLQRLIVLELVSVFVLLFLIRRLMVIEKG